MKGIKNELINLWIKNKGQFIEIIPNNKLYYKLYSKFPELAWNRTK